MLLNEFEADWVARGRSRTTAYEYCRHVRRMGITDEPPSAAWMRERISKRLDEVTSQTVLVETRAAKAYCPWPCQSPRWWPGKVLAVVSR